jgi:hypothetical protein
MHRTQVSLEDKQYRNLQRYAKLKNRSIAAVIRELLDAHIPVEAAPQVAVNPLLSLKGTVSGKNKTRGKNHNDFLYAHERRWNEGQP